MIILGILFGFVKSIIFLLVDFVFVFLVGNSVIVWIMYGISYNVENSVDIRGSK